MLFLFLSQRHKNIHPEGREHTSRNYNRPRICRIKADNEGRSSWLLISSTICVACSLLLRASYFGCHWIHLTNSLPNILCTMWPRGLYIMFVQRHHLDTSKPALSPRLLFLHPAVNRIVPPYEPVFLPDKGSLSSDCCLFGGEATGIFKEPIDNYDCNKQYINKVLFCPPCSWPTRLDWSCVTFSPFYIFSFKIQVFVSSLKPGRRTYCTSLGVGVGNRALPLSEDY